MNRKTPMLPGDDVRETPPDKFAEISARVGGFTLDVCATHDNAKCALHYTQNGLWETRAPGVVQGAGDGHCRDGLTGSWAGQRCWCNPPFSDIGAWVEKAWRSHDAALVVMLVPATRTEQPFWQRWVEPWRDGRGYPQELRQHGFAPPDWRLNVKFLPGRWHFLKDGKPIMSAPKLSKRTGKPLKATRAAPKFGCALLIWTHHAR